MRLLSGQDPASADNELKLLNSTSTRFLGIAGAAAIPGGKQVQLAEDHLDLTKAQLRLQEDLASRQLTGQGANAIRHSA